MQLLFKSGAVLHPVNNDNLTDEELINQLREKDLIEESDEFEIFADDAILPTQNGGEITRSAVNVERDRRIAGGVEFNGLIINGDAHTMSAIRDKAALADRADRQGVAADKADWEIENIPFTWRCAKNEDGVRPELPLFIEGMQELHKTSSLHKTVLKNKANVLKAMIPIPEDFKEDSYWI